jgi:hypothetical protein
MNFLNKLKVFFFGHEVKPGQVWGYCYREANPFMEAEYYMVTVTGVKDGWVAYWDQGTKAAPTHKFKLMYDKLLRDVE